MPWYSHIVDVELERILQLSRAKAALQSNPTLANLVQSFFGSVDNAAEVMNNFLRSYAGLDTQTLHAALATAIPSTLRINRLRRVSVRELARAHPELNHRECIGYIDQLSDDQICQVVAEEHARAGESPIARGVGEDAESWLSKVWHWILDHLPQIILGILSLLLI